MVVKMTSEYGGKMCLFFFNVTGLIPYLRKTSLTLGRALCIDLEITLSPDASCETCDSCEINTCSKENLAYPGRYLYMVYFNFRNFF